MHYLLHFSQDLAHVTWQSSPINPQLAPNQGSLAAFIEAATKASVDTGQEIRVTIIVPGQAVTIHGAKLPTTMRHARLRQAVPYALEEELSADIESLHFAMADKADKGVWPVAVVKKSQLRDWLAPLQEHGVTIEAIVPDFLAIPIVDDAWHLVCDDDAVICRQQDFAGFTLEKSLLRDFLKLHLAQTALPPARIVITGLDGKAILPENTLPDNIQVIYNDSPAPLFSLFETGLNQSAKINLCQAEFQQKVRTGRASQLTRLSVIFAGLCLLMFMLGQTTQYLYFKRQNTIVDGKIKSLYKQAYPDATRVTSPKSRIENEIKALGAAPHGEIFLQLLQQTGKVMQGKASIESLNYKDNKLQIRFKIDSFAALEAIVDAWRQSGLQVQQDQANSQDDGVMAAMTVSLSG